MFIDAGRKQVWEVFSIQINSRIEFLPGKIYHLSGRNASGKSSFLTQILLPALQNREDIYTLYLEQQIHLQMQAVKAYAGIMPPRRIVKTEIDAVTFLLDNLLLALGRSPRLSYILLDENPQEDLVRDFAHQLGEGCCLIFSSHSAVVGADVEIVFDRVSSTLSNVDVRVN